MRLMGLVGCIVTANTTNTKLVGFMKEVDCPRGFKKYNMQNVMRAMWNKQYHLGEDNCGFIRKEVEFGLKLF